LSFETKHCRHRNYVTGGRSHPPEQAAVMCEKCTDIDNTIERYRRILLAIGDQLTIDRTKEMIADLQAQKAALHPEQAQ
jgi:hypothetical protein